MITWKETRRRLREDKKRLLLEFKKTPSMKPIFLCLHPSYQCIFIFRLSHFFYVRNWRLTARFLWHLNIIMTGVDISPMSDLGSGTVIRRPEKVIIIGNAGENCTFMGQGGLGAGRKTTDIGAGPGLPILANNVFVEFGGVILGPVHVGNNVTVGARTLVTRDVPDGAFVTPSQKFNDSVDKVNLRQEKKREKVKEPFWSQINKDLIRYYDFSAHFEGADIPFLRKVSAFLTPPLLCVFFYRISHRLFISNWKRLAGIFFAINYIFHRIHISPGSEIGSGLYIPHTPGVIFNGSAGDNLVLYANSMVSSQEVHMDTSKTYPDSPVLGNNVIVGSYSVITGGITVGDNTTVGVSALLNESVEENSIIMSRERMKIETAE